MEHLKMYIHGEFVEAKDGERKEAIDPGTGKPFLTFAYGGVPEASAAVDVARETFDSGVWSDLPVGERARILMDFSDLLYEVLPRLALYDATDTGGLLGMRAVEVVSSAGTIRNSAWYAAHKFPWREELPNARNFLMSGMSYLKREPLGVCASIIPFNYPMQMAFQKIVWALAMGNTLVLKPASVTSVSSLLIAEILDRSEIPKGVVNIITGPGEEVGEALVSSPKVNKVSLVGSTAVGRRILELASRNMTRSTMELGGKSAAFVLADADMDLAVDGSIWGTFLHSGQVCESGTRVFVDESIYESYLERLRDRVAGLTIGYQLDFATKIGPLVSSQQRETVETYVELGKKEGFRLVCGGKRPKVSGYEDGFYFEPTIFADVDNRSRIAQEEIFGPVVCVMPFRDLEEAIQMANDSAYGLGGGVWCKDVRKGEYIASKLQTGTVWINDWHHYHDFYPFGGYKHSGIGKERGAEGFAAYTNTKRIHISPEGKPDNRVPLNKLMLNYEKPSISWHFEMPTKINAGPGFLTSLPNEINLLNGRRAVLITDQGLVRAGVADRVARAMGNYCVGVFDGVVEDSSYATVDAAVAYCKTVGADILVSLGGGSSMDTTKVVAATLTNGGTATDNLSSFRLNSPQTPHIAIPTTAGTGSETTNVAVIKNTKTKRKINLCEFSLIPQAAILDAELAVSLPKKLTACTGMDALSHAVSSCCQLNLLNGMAFDIALRAISLIAQYLPKAVADGQDIEARHYMAIAAMYAGVAICQTSTGIEHAMAHAVGAKQSMHHGMLCGLFLPYAMEFNKELCAKQLAAVAGAFGADTRKMSDLEAADEAIERTRNLMMEVGQPLRLSEVGLKRELLGSMAMESMAEIPIILNPRPATAEQVLEIFEAAY